MPADATLALPRTGGPAPAPAPAGVPAPRSGPPAEADGPLLSIQDRIRLRALEAAERR